MDSYFCNDFRVFKDSVINSYCMLHSINIDNNKDRKKYYSTKIRRNARYMDYVAKGEYMKNKVNGSIEFLNSDIILDFIDADKDEYLLSLVQKSFDKKYKHILPITDVILYNFYILDDYYVYTVLRGTIKKRKGSFLKLKKKDKRKKYKLDLKLSIFCIKDEHI